MVAQREYVIPGITSTLIPDYTKEDHVLLEANKSDTKKAIENCGLGNDKVIQMKLLNLPDPKDKTANGLFYKTVTLGENKCNGTTNGFNLLESMNMKNKSSTLKDHKLCCEKDELLAGHANIIFTVNPKTCGHYLCLETKEEFSFLLLPDFLILSVSVLFMAYGCSSPLVYLVPYALSVGVAHQNAAFLMSIFGISSIVGNVTFGWLTDRP